MLFYFSSSDVQCGHFVASIEISEQQYGHTLVVGAAGSAGSSFFLPMFLKELIPLTSMKRTMAVNKKVITFCKKLPYLISAVSVDAGVGQIIAVNEMIIAVMGARAVFNAENIVPNIFVSP